jgi:F420-dependent oxidoreductase-like protein
VKLATSLDYASGFREGADAVVELERAGLDVVWVAEAYGFDAPSQMGYLAARTQHVQIGSAVLSVFSRTPALLAQTAAGIDALSGGRCMLGLGTSGPQVVEGWHGVPFSEPLERTREVIEICRAVWRREPLVHDGRIRIPLPPEQGTGLGKPLKMLTHLERDRIPIWLAALGPRNVELASSVAEGWLPLFFVPELSKTAFGPALERGMARRPPELGPLEVAAGGSVAIGDRLEHLRELRRGQLALYVGGMGARGKNFYNALVRRYGFEAEADRIQELYLAGHKDEAAAAVPAELLEKTSLIGPRSYVAERVAAYREAGVTVLNVTPVGPEPLRTIETLKGLLG